MKTKTFVIALLCLMLVSIQGAMLVNAKMGSITFHVFKDLDRDLVFDAGEPSPPWAIVRLKMQGDCPFPWFKWNRTRIIGDRGDVTYRFVWYPCDYRLVANYVWWEIGSDFWTYDGILRLDEKNIGTKLYIPLTEYYIP